MTYAIHLSDLAALPEIHPLRWLITPFLTEQTIVLSSKFDAIAVALAPHAILDLEAAIQVAMSAPLPGQHYSMRFYRRSAGRWCRITPPGPVYLPVVAEESLSMIWIEKEYQLLHSPEGAAHMGKTIDGIFSLLEQIEREIEELKVRLDLIESQATSLQPPNDGRKYWFNSNSGEWIPYRPRM